ncbi:MAG: peptidoglycan DD-metalloendopeptidase family protein [Reyranellaceae bacterium]
MRFNAMRLLARALVPVLAPVLALSLAAGCSVYDKVVYSGRAGTVEQPGSAAEAGTPAIYVVAGGDTVNGIARRFNVAPQTIIERNNLQPPYTIRTGQWLEVPASGAAMAAAPAPASTGMITPGSVSSEPLPPPSDAGSTAVSPAPAASPPSSAGAPTSVTPAAPPATAAPAAPSAPAVAPATQTAARPAPVPSGPVRFDWPLRGQIVSGFGPQSGGVQNDGINIAAARGTPVKAAAAGNVLYAGEEVRGFGKLVLIGHADGYVTAYAHNDELNVVRGASVAPGQVIAKVGQSGNVTSPQLHFEIRQRNKAIDPLPLLGQ